jgi:aryl-alcohol dehydrogenase-like predicted oxidoreductase
MLADDTVELGLNASLGLRLQCARQMRLNCTIGGPAMEKRRLGKTDMDVSPLGFGGAEIGFEEASQETVNRLLPAALDAGLNIIDTAECYEDSETLIGNAVAHRRGEYFLFTKCGHADGWSHPDWSKDALLLSIQRSLKRLQTDCLDLVQLHSCNLSILRKGEVVEALEEARRQGLTRYIGYSGDGVAARFALESEAFDTLQTSVSVADQEALTLTLPLARAKDVGVIAKRPIANAAWRHNIRPVGDYSEPYWERLQLLDFDFMRGNVAAAAGIALRFTLSVPGVHTAIVGTKNPDRWRQNLELLAEGPLPKDLWNEITARWNAVARPDWVGQI